MTETDRARLQGILDQAEDFEDARDGYCWLLERLRSVLREAATPAEPLPDADAVLRYTSEGANAQGWFCGPTGCRVLFSGGVDVVLAEDHDRALAAAVQARADAERERDEATREVTREAGLLANFAPYGPWFRAALAKM